MRPSDLTQKVVVLEPMVLRLLLDGAVHSYLAITIVTETAFPTVGGAQRGATAKSTAGVTQEPGATWTRMLDSGSLTLPTWEFNVTIAHCILKVRRHIE